MLRVSAEMRGQRFASIQIKHRAVTPRRVHASHAQEVFIASQYIPGEYAEPPRSKLMAAARRGIGLTSDLVVLTIASPFFAVWFLYRGVLHLKRSQR